MYIYIYSLILILIRHPGKGTPQLSANEQDPVESESPGAKRSKVKQEHDSEDEMICTQSGKTASTRR